MRRTLLLRPRSEPDLPAPPTRRAARSRRAGSASSSTARCSTPVRRPPRVGQPRRQRRRVDPRGVLLAPDPAHRARRRRLRALRRGRAGRRAPRARRAAGGPRHAGLGGAAPRRSGLAAARPRRLRPPADHARHALRPERLLVDRASRGREAADPRVADLERAEPDALLERRPLGAVLRRSCSRPPTRRSRRPTPARRRSSPACRTRAGRRWRRSTTPARAARSTSSTLHPYTGKPKNVIRIVKIVRRVMARHRDSKLPVWVTELPGPRRRARPTQHGDFETTEPARRAGSRPGCRCWPSSGGRCGSSASTGTRGSRPRASPAARSTIRGCGGAQRPVARRARAQDVPAPGPPAAGLHEARRRRAPLRLRA